MENARKSCRQTGPRISKVSKIALNLHICALPFYLLSWTQDTACSTSLQERFAARSCNPDKASCHAMWARCAAAWLEAVAAVMARVVAEHRESQSTVRQPRDERNHKRVFHRTDPLVLTSLSETLFLWLLSQISKHWQVELAKSVTNLAKRYRSNWFNTDVQHLGFSSEVIPQTKNDSDLTSSHLARPSRYRRPTVVDDIWEGGWAPTKIQHLHLQGAIHLLEWSRTIAIDPILKDLSTAWWLGGISE